MTLEFKPPQDLINAYLARPSPGEIASNSIQEALKQYAQEKKDKEKEDVQKQQLALLQKNDAREGMKQFYDIGDASSLPQDEQKLLNSQPQGPSLPVNVPPPAGTQGPANQQMVPPQLPPLIERHKQFLAQYPGGFKGADLGLKGEEKSRNAALQQSEIEKNQAQAALFKKGGASGGKGSWKMNQFTGQYDFYPSNPGEAPPGMPSSQPGGQPANGRPLLPFRDQAKLDKEKPKAEGSLRETLTQYDNMIKEAEAIKNDPDLGHATGMASPLAMVPGTGAKRVGARLETLKAKTLLNVLSSLKSLSANGSSGFGALSNTEGENIRNSISSLDRGQSTKDFSDSLNRFVSDMKGKKDNLKRTYEDTYGTPLGQLDSSDGSGPGDLVHLSTKELQALRDKLTAHQDNGN